MRVLQFITIVLIALELIPTGAHFFELPNKMALSRNQYFVVQQIYSGWAYFGVVLIGAIIASCALAIALRHRRPNFWYALAGFILISATLAIFFTWTYPANLATNNWTMIPGNWQQLRIQWEYSHAANAVLTFGSLCCVTAAIITTSNLTKRI